MMKNQFKSLSVQAAFYMGTIFIWGIHTLCALALPVQPDTVHVAPPTGERESDRASILAALDQVEPGGTIQFAAGEYLVGEVLRIDTPGITLLGHPDATMLRGCEDSAFDEVGRAMVDAWTGERTPAETFPIVYACGLFELTGGHGIIRGLTFEQAWSGLMLGCCERENRLLATEGGYLIEDNTFRNLINGIRGRPLASEPSVIRSNRFVNTFHAVAAFGSHMQVLDNKISVPEPARVSDLGYPGFAISLGGGPLHAKANMPNIRCETNVISGNRIEGHPDGIIIGAFPGSDCYDNVIRENTVVAATPSFDRTRPSGRHFNAEDTAPAVISGVPISLFGVADPDGNSGTVGETVIETNTVIGAHGVAIELLRASGNRISNNIITDVRHRDPFPGNVLAPRPEWDGANGSAIWVSPGSDGNEIVDNTFEEIASHPIVIEGDSNVVKMLTGAEEVRDIGTGNRVTAANQTYESKFIEAGGVRLHYLDFGGEGLPLIFIHSESWDAFTYKDFGSQFVDRNCVLAVTRPGYGQSEFREEGFSVAGQAESLLDFMDALEIDRAVFAGNSSPTAYITYLAEHHPERVAGVIYLSGLNLVRTNRYIEGYPFEAEEMARRAMGRSTESDSLMAERTRMLDAYEPEFMQDENSEITVPALAFAARSGRLGWEELSFSLLLVGSPLLSEYLGDPPDSPFTQYARRLTADREFRLQQLEQIEDSLARTFLIGFANDPARQEKVQQYHNEIVLPARNSGRERFQQALGENLRLVSLDISAIEGYEYRDSPELIVPHIRDFLEEIERLDHERRSTNPASTQNHY